MYSTASQLHLLDEDEEDDACSAILNVSHLFMCMDQVRGNVGQTLATMAAFEIPVYSI